MVFCLKWLSAMCHQGLFASGSFMAINRVVLNDEHGFSFGHKKALHSHVRLIVFRFIVTSQQSLSSLLLLSRRLHEQGVDENRLRGTFNDGSFGCTVVCAARSVTKVGTKCICANGVGVCVMIFSAGKCFMISTTGFGHSILLTLPSELFT